MKKINKITYTAILTATALILSYVETVTTAGIMLPGIKLGLSNIAVVIALYTAGTPYAIIIGVLKCFISLLIFGRLSGLLYSLMGIIAAIAAMILIKKIKFLSIFSVNISGSFFHIIGQLIAATFILESSEVWKLFPLYGTLALISGIITYIPEYAVLKIIMKINIKEVNKNAE